jgi:hypothetical protein
MHNKNATMIRLKRSANYKAEKTGTVRRIRRLLKRMTANGNMICTP